jgi:hypothetical protein
MFQASLPVRPILGVVFGGSVNESVRTIADSDVVIEIRKFLSGRHVRLRRN